MRTEPSIFEHMAELQTFRIAVANASIDGVAASLRTVFTGDLRRGPLFRIVGATLMNVQPAAILPVIDCFGDDSPRVITTCLIAAARHGKVEHAKALLPRVTVLGCDEAKRTPLHIAAWFGFENIVEVLLAHPAGIAAIPAVDTAGRTALHCASWFGHTGIVARLIGHGAEVLKDAHGDTPLHYACRHNRGQVVAVLLEAGADATELNGEEKTPAALAEDENASAALESLEVKKGKLGTMFTRQQKAIRKSLDEIRERQRKHQLLVHELRQRLHRQHGHLSQITTDCQHMVTLVHQITHAAENWLRASKPPTIVEGSRFTIKRA